MHGFDNNRRRWMRQAGALAVGAGAAFDGGLDGAEAGGVLDEAQTVADGVGGSSVSIYVKRDDSAESLELAECRRVGGVRWQTGIAGKRDAGVVGESLGECLGVGLRAFEAESKSAEAAGGEEYFESAGGGSVEVT